MSSSDTLTYDDTPPHRPALDELGGGAKVNGLPAPDPVTMLRAEDVNQLSQQVAAIGRVMPVAVVQVDVSGIVYSATTVTCAPTGMTTANFNLVRNGAGDITITWTSDLLPSPVARPRVSVQGSTALLSAVESLSAVSCRVRLVNHANTATDSAFDLDIF